MSVAIGSISVVLGTMIVALHNRWIFLPLAAGPSDHEIPLRCWPRQYIDTILDIEPVLV